jgi:hypothetical protein
MNLEGEGTRTRSLCGIDAVEGTGICVGVVVDDELGVAGIRRSSVMVQSQKRAGPIRATLNSSHFPIPTHRPINKPNLIRTCFLSAQLGIKVNSIRGSETDTTAVGQAPHSRLQSSPTATGSPPPRRGPPEISAVRAQSPATQSTATAGRSKARWAVAPRWA